MSKYRWMAILITLVSALLLSACGASTPVSTPSPVVEETVAATTYPEPVNTYPQPESVPTAVSSDIPNAYPGPGQGGEFTDWSRAEQAILNGEVAELYRDNSMHVTLVLKNGGVWLALEPALDEVVRVVERCGEPCKDIQQGTP